jgi:hypothetical protein
MEIVPNFPTLFFLKSCGAETLGMAETIGRKGARRRMHTWPTRHDAKATSSSPPRGARLPLAVGEEEGRSSPSLAPPDSERGPSGWVRIGKKRPLQRSDVFRA